MVGTTEDIADKIKNGDRSAFEYAFKAYYGALFNLATGLLKDSDLAEERVQETFIKLWEKREQLKEGSSLLPFLIVMTRNSCYNYIRHQGVAQKYVSEKQKFYQNQVLNDDFSDITDELLDRMHACIETLPEKCREVLQLNRFAGMSHKQIAEKLSISPKTVENHISKAMKILRKELKDARNLTIVVMLIGGLVINGVIS